MKKLVKKQTKKPTKVRNKAPRAKVPNMGNTGSMGMMGY